MRRSTMSLLAGLCAAASFTACSSFTSSGDPLNETEAGALASALVGRSFPGTGGASMTTTPPGAATMPMASSAPVGKITVNINDSGPCPNGGTVAVTGSLAIDVNQTTQTGNL